jgi:hypothetical protein
MRLASSIRQIQKLPLLMHFVCTFLLLLSTQLMAADTEFDHFNTGFPLDGLHERVQCDSCHVSGTFKSV